MKLKKAPNQLSTEELLEQLSNPLEEPKEKEIPEIINYKNDVMGFLSTFQILPGKEAIKKHVFFAIYKSWSRSPLDRKSFECEINRLFISNNKQYYINQNTIKLTYEAYTKFKKERKQLKSKHWAKHYQRFLDYYSLTPGTFWIEKDILYYIYDKYSHNILNKKNNRGTLGTESFFKFCDVFLKQKIVKGGIIYGLSDNIQNCFEPGQLERMRKEYVKKKAPKKRNKKK